MMIIGKLFVPKPNQTRGICCIHVHKPSSTLIGGCLPDDQRQVEDLDSWSRVMLWYVLCYVLGLDALLDDWNRQNLWVRNQPGHAEEKQRSTGRERLGESFLQCLGDLVMSGGFRTLLQLSKDRGVQHLQKMWSVWWEPDYTQSWDTIDFGAYCLSIVHAAIVHN